MVVTSGAAATWAAWQGFALAFQSFRMPDAAFLLGLVA